VEKAAARPHGILVAEDDAQVRRISTFVLSDAGYQVDAAEDGAVAWDRLQLKSYDLLITDHNMPNMSGIELIKKVRAARMALPVILISGTMPEDELKAHAWLQINATLPKPCDIVKLLRTVKEVLDATGDVTGPDRPPRSG